MSGIRWTAEQLADYQRRTTAPKPARSGPVILPLRTKSTPNEREHWAVRAKRTKHEREMAAARCQVAVPPCTVTLTRIDPRALDDDNLRSALKAVRDGIADALGVNDRDPAVTWCYAQRRGKVREYGVEVTIT